MVNVIHTENGRLRKTSYADVGAMVQKGVERKNIVIHVHGGLVSENSARQTAARLSPYYDSDGAGAVSIFPVWESALHETLLNNLRDVAREKFFRIVTKRVRKIAKRKARQSSGERVSGTLPMWDGTDEENDIDTAFETLDYAKLPADFEMPAELTELSQAEMHMFEEELKLDLELDDCVEAISNGLLSDEELHAAANVRGGTISRASSETLMSPDAVRRYMDQPDHNTRGLFSGLKIIKAVVSIAYRVIKRCVKKRDHGVYTTIIEEILREFYLANVGEKVWKMMKGDTKDCFGDDPHVFGGTALLSALGAHLDAGKQVRVTLVGHSAGAVYLSHLIDEADEIFPEAFKFDVVFLAPAATIDLVEKKIVRNAHRINDFRMFTMTDRNERKDRLVGFLYPHSLLYFISGVLEGSKDEPIVGMSRFFNGEQFDRRKFSDINKVKKFVAAKRDGLCWSTASDGRGRNTKALKHGDFDNDVTTMESLQAIARYGFGRG